MRIAIAILLAVALTWTVTAQTRVPPEVWRNVAQKMPVGSVVKVRTVSRQTLTGTLFVIDDTGVIVKPRTRIPEPARRVTFDQIDDLRLVTDRSGFAKAAAIGAGIGAAVFAIVAVIMAGID